MSASQKLDKNFDPSTVEARLYADWEDGGCFEAGRRPEAEPYTIVIPPPNVTGSLHMGHALNNTLQDILCRFERMRGRDVLWQPGTDHAGIATQMVVERQLAEQGNESRRDMGREKFLEKVWQWKEESGSTITRQLRRLGASCDWSRERFTMDEGLSKAVLKVFVTLYEQGHVTVHWNYRFSVKAKSQILVCMSGCEGLLHCLVCVKCDGPVVSVPYNVVQILLQRVSVSLVVW